MSLVAVQTSCIVVTLKDRASSLLTTSCKRSNAMLNARGGVVVDVEVMTDRANV